MYRYRDRHVQKCQQLEKENDEQREELNKAILREKTMISTVQRCAKEKENLTKRMETMEIEVKKSNRKSVISRDKICFVFRGSHRNVKRHI